MDLFTVKLHVSDERIHAMNGTELWSRWVPHATTSPTVTEEGAERPAP